jgi:hypothetical protein
MAQGASQREQSRNHQEKQDGHGAQASDTTGKKRVTDGGEMGSYLYASKIADVINATGHPDIDLDRLKTYFEEQEASADGANDPAHTALLHQVLTTHHLIGLMQNRLAKADSAATAEAYARAVASLMREARAGAAELRHSRAATQRPITQVSHVNAQYIDQRQQLAQVAYGRSATPGAIPAADGPTPQRSRQPSEPSEAEPTASGESPASAPADLPERDPDASTALARSTQLIELALQCRGFTPGKALQPNGHGG